MTQKTLRKDIHFSDKEYIVNKFGSNSVVGAGWEVLWTNGDSYPFPTTADNIEVFSSLGNDTNDGGSGARKVTVEGLDDNWDLVSEDFTLAGATVQTSTNLFTRVFRAYVTECGTYGNTNLGVITVAHETSSDTLATIPVGLGQTEMAVYTVPRSHEAFLWRQVISVSESNDTANVRVVTRANADNVSSEINPFRVRSSIAGVSGVTVINYTNGIKIGEKTDIWFEAQKVSGGAGAGVDAEFELACYKKRRIL